METLYRSNTGDLSLWAIPYKMKPGQSPRDLLHYQDNWTWLGSPGWYGDSKDAILNLLSSIPEDAIPLYPGEWTNLEEWKGETK